MGEKMFSDVYRGKKVLVTGHTGFKGSWLTVWLLRLGAKVIGVSDGIPTEPSMFRSLNLEVQIDHHIEDVRNLDKINQIFMDHKPDFVFHLAAQPIVSVSFTSPCDTITTNAIGTMNILEVLRGAAWPVTAVIITSDKSYDNVEWEWGYKETDHIGGKDIYSGSKAAAEVIIKSYVNSFFSGRETNVNIGIGRAGNVIGGGDWAKDRIVVDMAKAWSHNKPVEIRCPDATRPWQHVLEPLSGYLALGEDLFLRNINHGEAFNFGPKAEQNRTVIELLDAMYDCWSGNKPISAYSIIDQQPFNEAGLLKLNCDKALFRLNWQAVLSYQETVEMTSDWYSIYFLEPSRLVEITSDQLTQYCSKADSAGLAWTD